MLRERYESEVDRLWSYLNALAEKSPHLQALYARDADSRVARLVQSAAFASARVGQQLGDDGQTLARPLTARALPEALRPHPAKAILQFSTTSADVGNGRGQVVLGHVDGLPIPFEVMWPVEVSPFQLVHARIDRVHAGQQVLRLTLEGRDGAILDAVLPDVVRLFAAIPPRVAIDLLHALSRASELPRLETFTTDGERLFSGSLPPGAVRWVRVDTDEPALVSARADRFRSGTLLRDLAHFPESFCFLDIDVRTARAENLARIELTLPLARVVDHVAGISSEDLKLFCAPATNQYPAAIEPLRSRGESQWSLSIAERPNGEILEIREIYLESRADAGGRIPVRSWEAPESPHRFSSNELYYVLTQIQGLTEDRTVMRLALKARGFSPDGAIHGEVLASDGTLAHRLGVGDIAAPNVGVANITRVTPSHRAVIGRNRPWRLHAYAVMPARRFAEPVHLTEFLRLHGSVDAHDGDAEGILAPRFQDLVHRREHRLVDGIFQWGGAFLLDVDPGRCNPGEVWLYGNMISIALAERDERLRFSQLEVRHVGTHARFTQYPPRNGERLPFLFG